MAFMRTRLACRPTPMAAPTAIQHGGRTHGSNARDTGFSDLDDIDGEPVDRAQLLADAVREAAHAVVAGLDTPLNPDIAPVGFLGDDLLEGPHQPQQRDRRRGDHLVEIQHDGPFERLVLAGALLQIVRGLAEGVAAQVIEARGAPDPACPAVGEGQVDAGNLALLVLLHADATCTVDRNAKEDTSLARPSL